MVMGELMYQYSISVGTKKKVNDKEREEQLNSLHSIVLHLPTIIKKTGLRKFDSQYEKFAQWLQTPHNELSSKTPKDCLSDINNHGLILSLIQSLPSYKH